MTSTASESTITRPAPPPPLRAADAPASNGKDDSNSPAGSSPNTDSMAGGSSAADGSASPGSASLGCLDVIAEWERILPAHLDELVPLHRVRAWFCQAFKYSEDTFKRTHLKEIDKNWFRGFFGVRVRPDTETGVARARPSSDLFYKSRVVWWLIERKKSPFPRYESQKAKKPDPETYR